MNITKRYVLGASILLFTGMSILALQLRSTDEISFSETLSLSTFDKIGASESVEVVGKQVETGSGSMSTQLANTRDADDLSYIDIEMKLAGLPTSGDNREAREHGYSRGDFAVEDIPIYESYATEALEKLALEGDFVASHVLAQRYREHGRLQEMQQVWMSAAIFGGTGTLRMYAQYNIRRADRVYGEQDPEKARQSLLKGLGAYEFARIRGDLLVDRMIQDNVIGAGVEVSEADWEEAREIGQLFYDMASRKRAELGLPEFDNSVSEGAKAVGETYAKGYRAQDLIE